MKTVLILFFVLIGSFANAANFRPDLVKPGQTEESSLVKLLGKPVRVVRDSPNHEYVFYNLDELSSMDATVSLRKGVVEYISYLCGDSMRDVRQKFEDQPSSTRTVVTGARGYAARLTQVSYEGKGRAYLYEPRTMKVRACVAWEPGRKFDELGR